MRNIDYFTDYTKGEVYKYGLKCISPSFKIDEREVVFIEHGQIKKIRIIHDINSRKFLQVRVAKDATVEIEVIIVAKEACITDSYIEILHEGDRGNSTLNVRGYAEGSGRIISRIRTHVPRESFHVHATQNVTLYQFGIEGVIDCIPILEVENKTTISSHAVRLEKINKDEYWQAEKIGIVPYIYQGLKKNSLLK